jgi:hypothetical protein
MAFVRVRKIDRSFKLLNDLDRKAAEALLDAAQKLKAISKQKVSKKYVRKKRSRKARKGDVTTDVEAT